MNNLNIKNSALAQGRKNALRRRRLVALLGCMVVLATAIALMVPAISMTRGALACDIPEHEHSDECYEQVLVCGLEEGDDHEHSDECYAQELVCGLEEHVHGPECYESDDAESSEASEDAGLSDEAQGTASEAKKDAESSNDATESAEHDAEAQETGDVEQQQTESEFPAQSFQADLTDDNNEPVVTVSVEAPEGAFPANTLMKIDGVAVDSVQERVEDALKEEGKIAADEAAAADLPSVKQMTAVDIAFFDAEGNLVQPSKKVDVRISADDVREAQKLALVHVLESSDVTRTADGGLVDADGKPFDDPKDAYDGAQVVKKFKLANKDEDDESVGNEDTLVFKADEFSPYVVVELDDSAVRAGEQDESGADANANAPRMLVANEGDYTVTVRFGSDAGIPNGAELKVNQIAKSEDQYAEVCEKAGDKLGDALQNAPATPLLLDISIWANGKEMEPAEGSQVSVEVKLAKESLDGLYTGEDSPILVNDEPLSAEENNVEQVLQVIHEVQGDEVEVVDVTEKQAADQVVGEFTTESFSNWLLYLDEDLEEITIGYGDTITLRPYSEWVWMKNAETTYADVTWNEPASNAYVTVTANRDYTDSQLGEKYTAYTLSADRNNPGSFEISRSNGKKIKVNVQPQPMSKIPPTVEGLPSVKVNLFNYNADKDLDLPGNTANSWQKQTKEVTTGWDWYGRPITEWRTGYFKFNPDYNGDDTNIAYPNPPYEKSVNRYSDLKFLGWGSGNVGSGADEYSRYWINSYDKVTPTQGIVKNTLKDNDANKNGYPQLSTNGQSLKYLFTDDPNVPDSDVKAYTDVPGLFQKDSNGYYYFNSNSNYAWYDQSSNQFVLYEHTYSQNTDNGITSKPIGFFPFHQYDSNNDLSPNHCQKLDHHFGMSMELPFEIPEDRLIDGKPISFEFSGDDDMWVFVDDDLVLDLGGIHQPITGKIDFTNNQVTAYNKETKSTNISVGTHTLRVFYLERGGCDSNCSIRFNLPLLKDLTLQKRLTGLTDAERAKYSDQEFHYEVGIKHSKNNIAGWDEPDSSDRWKSNDWRSDFALYSTKHATKNPENKTVLTHADGTTEEGVPVQNGMVTLKDGESFTIKDLPAADIFYAAEEDGLNMNMFETPHAERLFMDSVGQEHEEEIALHDDTTKYEEPGSGADPSQNLHDWETRPYALNDTEKIVYTNTLKETNLEVNKTWSDYATNKHEGDPVTFVVKATVPNDDPNGEPLPYEVAALKNGSADREFTLSDSNAWHQLIEHLPAYAPGTSGANPKPIAYTVEEKTTFEGYTTTVSSYGQSDLENVDVFKYWPDGNANHQGQNAEHIKVKLKDKDGRFVKANLRNGEYYFASYVSEQEATELPLSTDTYTVRVKNVPAREYAGEGAEVQEVVHAPLTFVQVGQDEDANTTGLVLFERPNTDQRIINTSISGNTPPTTSFEYHKRIDALRDGVDNPDTSYDEGEDLTDLYRLYLDYKINSLQAAEGVDLLFVIDHSGSMNNNAWGGNASRAPTVQEVLNGSNGQNGIIGEFLNVNNKNRWAAVGFSGWEPSYNPIANAGEKNSEVLSPGGTAYAWQSRASEISLPNYGANKLTDYTAGLWRAEQFLLRDDVKNDGRKKVVLFISDGIPTLYIPCEGTLVGADKAEGSGYYPDWFGGCPEQTYGQFWNFVSDLTSEDTYDYTFGEDIEFFAVGFGDSIQAQAGQWLLRNMVAAAYGKDLEKEKDQAFVENHFIPVNDSSRNYDAHAKLKEALEGILDMDETYSNMVVTDNLSKYVTIYGLNDDGSAPSDVLKRAGAKVTMSNPDDPANPFVLYKDGQMTDANNLAGGKTILQSVTYVPAVGQATQDSTGTVTATFSPDYEPLPGITYTLSFDVKTTPLAYATYANSGYDKIEGATIQGDEDTDFLGTDPANATSVGKDGFRSNNEATVTYKHNGEPEGGAYKHPVIQVSTRVVIAKVDQQGKPLQGAKFDLYKDGYDPKKSADENKKYLVRGGLESKVDEANNGTKDALIYKAGLQAGTYYLVETKAPDGFLKLEGPAKIVIAENNGATTVAASINGKAIGYPKLLKDSKTGEWHLVIDNSAGVELPNTGGPGAASLYALGFLCVAGATAFLLRRRLVR